MRNSKIFISGGAGFIGSALCRELADHNQIIIYDSLHRNALQYTRLDQHPNVRVIQGDILDEVHLRQSIEDAEYVVHLAAIAGVATVVNNPALTLRVNLIGTYQMLETVRIKNPKVKRFVDFSTSEVYGPNVFRADEEGMTTQGPLSAPRWTYATSKLASEYLTHSYFREYGLPTTSIRPFNIYGPYQIGEGAIHHFIVNALKGEPLVVHNDGDQIRSWCYVTDCVTAVLAVLENPDAVNHSFNVGNPQATCTVLGLAQTVLRLTGSQSSIQFREIAYPDVEVRVPSIDKARRVLGFEPQVGLEEGLTRTIEFYSKHLRQG